MLDRDEDARVVKIYLPQAENTIVDRVVAEVTQDAENIIHSLIRRAIAQVRDTAALQKGY